MDGGMLAAWLLVYLFLCLLGIFGMAILLSKHVKGCPKVPLTILTVEGLAALESA